MQLTHGGENEFASTDVSWLCWLRRSTGVCPNSAEHYANKSATTQTSIDSILGAGYEIKAVTVMSDATTKEVYTGQAGLPSQVFITLQKGTSVAVCEGASSSWIWLSDAQMTDATRCFKR